MKQSLAIALAGFQGLGGDDFRERPVDRIAALGAIQIKKCEETLRQVHLATLGVELIAFKFGNRAPSRKDAEDLLGIALGWPQHKLKLDKVMRFRVSGWAVEEWAIDFCPSCQGAKEVPFGSDREGAQPMKSCGTCGGTGKRRYSDNERFHALGGDYSRAMSTAHGLIGRAEDLATSAAARMLERWGR